MEERHRRHGSVTKILIFDPFAEGRSESIYTGGPRYFRETLIPRFESYYPEANVEVAWRWTQLMSRPASDNSVVVLIADDPRVVLPILLLRITRLQQCLVYVPVMHLSRNPLKRKGPRWRSAVSWLSQHGHLRLSRILDAQYISINAWTYSQIVSAVGTSERVHLIAPRSVYEPISSEVRAASGPYLLYLGRLVEHKGALEVVQLFEQIAKRANVKGLRLVIAGDGQLRVLRKIRKQISRSRFRDFISLEVRCSDERRDALLASAKCVTVLSHEEGYSYVIQEAHAYGTPVVAWALPELTSVWGDIDGVHLVPENSYRQYTDRVQSLLNS